jgi:hypothetical protein
MDKIEKAARVMKLAADEGEMALVNRQSLRELTADEVFLFRVAACDNQVDRDFERFTEDALKGLAPLFVGRPILMDHSWSAHQQTARIYAAEVETEGEISRLVLRAYMLDNEDSRPTIAAIEGGILREVSVGCAVERSVCSICGKDRRFEACGHYPGREYGGQICHFDLDGAADAYEVSFVAVPAQPGAGIVKRYGEPPEEPGEAQDPETEQATQLARARLELEKLRFGGTGT